MICGRNFSTQEVLFLVQAVDSAVTTVNNGSYTLLLIMGSCTYVYTLYS